ncbi:GldL-related protein [Chryseobacterium sp. 2TAF14]|uniref:GldL-related protein n=1 Tax=Chryseobacterium sp. 2TAF14 TaxID=3233007 RepID=UPI003F8DD51E
MKTKHTFLIFLTGFLINIVGAFFKITHWSFGIFNANIIFTIGSIFEIIGALLFLYKLFTYPKFKDFMNW